LSTISPSAAEKALTTYGSDSGCFAHHALRIEQKFIGLSFCTRHHAGNECCRAGVAGLGYALFAEDGLHSQRAVAPDQS